MICPADVDAHTQRSSCMKCELCEFYLYFENGAQMMMMMMMSEALVSHNCSICQNAVRLPQYPALTH